MEYRHILAATDFTPTGDYALETAAVLAHRLGARLTLAHVVEHFPEDQPVETIVPEDQDPETGLRLHAERRLTEWAAAHGGGDVVVVISRRSAAHELPGLVQREGCDLLVIGAGGRTAAALAREAPCHLLLARRKG